jgi:hypothetical protein
MVVLPPRPGRRVSLSKNTPATTMQAGHRATRAGGRTYGPGQSMKKAYLARAGK